MKSEMKHMIILLPGIMGSVLKKDGNDVWALSGQALWQHLRTLGESIDSLKVQGDDGDDDPKNDDLGDGIEATSLIQDLHSVPFLVEHAGYSVMVKGIKNFFNVTEGKISQPNAKANFFTFPYDWRRDNRVTARKLKEFIEKQLPVYRKASGIDDAQVILIGHSMGGLISRYYLEVLEGWHDCRALFTVGSPHRGAVKALNILSNGVVYNGKLIKGIEITKFTELVRTFRSAWQIMPTYPVVKINDDDDHVRVSETTEIPNIDQKLASDTRSEFLDAIYQAAMGNRKNPPSGYEQRTIPWIGTRHDTYQSAQLRDKKLSLSYEPPKMPGKQLPLDLADGDGTVPRVSAIPADMDGQRHERFAVERHGWLTNNKMSLDPILDTLKQIASPDSAEFFGEPEVTEARGPSINLRLESLYARGDPMTAQVTLVDAGDLPQTLDVIVSPVGHTGQTVTKSVEANIFEKTPVEIDGLASGLYQLVIKAKESIHHAPEPTHGVFEVFDPQEGD